MLLIFFVLCITGGFMNGVAAQEAGQSFFWAFAIGTIAYALVVGAVICLYPFIFPLV